VSQPNGPKAALEGGETGLEGHASSLEEGGSSGRNWVQLSRESYDQSTDWMTANLRRQWERNLSNNRSTHPPGSKYQSVQYKHRNKIFRPKTRSATRRNEANAVAAFFSTSDVTSCTAHNPSDKKQVASAAVMKELLNYRLPYSINWFKTLVGAYQETMVMSTVVSYQSWKYKTKAGKDTVEREFDGYVSDQEQVDVMRVLEDRPSVDLRPSENIRIHPGADWIDPVNSSPYLIDLIPMYLIDVQAKMEEIDRKTGQPKWMVYSKGEILSARRHEYDATRQIREGGREDPKADTNTTVTDHTIVWVHRNIHRIDDEDLIWYTLGTEFLLSEPKPLIEAYPWLKYGERPYVMGQCTIDANIVYPQSIVEYGQDIQAATNNVQNQRLDNVELVLNRRWKIKRGARVDMAALQRNVPGGGVLMDNTQTDVVAETTQDVTRSSYEEQDRLSADHDDVTGVFSTGSVQTNRKMNETVGGMELMTGDANMQSEYMLRTFAETWVQKVLDQIVRLEQYYETDEVALAVAGEKAQLRNKHKISDPDFADLLNQNLLVDVNVGVGATNPFGKVNRLRQGLTAVAEISPKMAARIDGDEVADEIFGAMGYQDSSRFFIPEEELPEQGPNPEMLKIQIEQQKMQLNGQLKQAEMQMKGQEMQAKNQIAQMELQIKMTESQKGKGAEGQKLAIQQEIARVREENARYIAEMQDETTRIIAEMNDATKREIALGEQQLKRSEGMRSRMHTRAVSNEKETKQREMTNDQVQT